MGTQMTGVTKQTWTMTVLKTTARMILTVGVVAIAGVAVVAGVGVLNDRAGAVPPPDAETSDVEEKTVLQVQEALRVGSHLPNVFFC